MTSLYFINANVGSGIEITGDRVISMLDDYPGEVIVYKYQNPPYLIFEDLIKNKPDTIIINEYYSRSMQAVAYYKIAYPNTKVIILNHDWGRVRLVPFDVDNPKDEHGICSHDEVTLLNNAWRNVIDIIINMNHKPVDADYPEWAKYRSLDMLHPIPDSFTSNVRWGKRHKHFMYFGIVWEHRLPRVFLDSLKDTGMHVDVYGSLREDTESDRSYNEFLLQHPNVDYRGYIPDNELINTLNQYRFWILPGEGTELFCIAMAEVIRCNVIALVSSPIEGHKSDWANWADGCYFRYNDNKELLNRMQYYFQHKDDPDIMADLERFSEKAGKKVRELTSYDKFKQTLLRYV
jgi:glycosyltransferase involved in cell wall biosynthesis